MSLHDIYQVGFNHACRGLDKDCPVIWGNDPVLFTEITTAYNKGFADGESTIEEFGIMDDDFQDYDYVF